MNLNQIHYLLAIHQYGSITQAAEKLFVAAPSISIAIRNLEKEVGCPLLIRHHNGVTFTEEGEKAIHFMQVIEENIDNLYHLTKETAISGDISIGVSLHAKSTLFLPTFLYLQANYPGIILEASDERSRDILHAVEQNRINLGLIHYSDVDEPYFTKNIQRNGLKFEKLYEGNMLFVVHEHHPLTKCSDLSAKDVLQYPFLNYDKTDFTKEHQKVLQQLNPNYRLLPTSDRDMFRDLIHSSNAVTLMPSLNEIYQLKQFAGLVFLHVADFVHPYVLGYLHNGDPLTRAEEIVIAALKQEADLHK